MDRNKVREKSRTVLATGYVHVIDLVLDVPTQDGAMMEDVSREIVLRPDASAALVHDVERDVFILAEQFRFPAYLRGSGWFIELVAGRVDNGETPEACIIREIQEEIGYRASTVEELGWFHSATAYSTEKIFLFYAPVKTADFIDPGAKGTDHGEDIHRVELSRADLLARLRACDFIDPKLLSLGAWAVTKFG